MAQPVMSAIKRLFAVSGNRCAFPGCSTPLVEEVSGKVIGQLCHIRAQRAGGPRYEASQSEMERHAFENLILLCPTHHNMIDTDVEIYSVHRLQQMKTHHESLSIAHPAVVDVSDEIANKLLKSVVSANLTDGSLVTSVNQSGGQTAHSITNIHRQVILGKINYSECLSLDTFAINAAQCDYDEYRLDPSRPFWPEEADPITVCVRSNGRVERYGREFSSLGEAEEYGNALTQTYNHYSFYEGAPYKIFFKRLRGKASGNPSNYPVFYASLSNNSGIHVVLSALSATVHQVQPLKARGESHVLFPLVAYKIAIRPMKGVYRIPAVPSLKIESGDAAAFHVVLEPTVQIMGGYRWLMSLRFDCGNQSVTTDTFVIVM